ncbi:MAG: hypothetical protein VW362_07120 [Candidatus Nanopelagicales bacterium]
MSDDDLLGYLQRQMFTEFDLQHERRLKLRATHERIRDIIATIEHLRTENQKLRTDLYYVEQRWAKACRELDRRDELEAANDDIA